MGWQFEKRVSVGDIIAFVAAFLAVIYAYTTLDRRVAVLEAIAVQQEANDRRQDAERIAIRNDIRQDLRDIKTEISEVRKALSRGRP